MASVYMSVTGFGEFAGVAANPTADIVGALGDRVAESLGDDADEVCLDCQVLEVSGRAVRGFLAEAFEKMRATMSQDAEDERAHCVALHFGVDAGATCFRVEAVGHNSADFRVPDEKGWAPRDEKIWEAEELGAAAYTHVPVRELVRALQADFDVEVSNDAGRFVCNFTFVESLHRSAELRAQLADAGGAQRNVWSLFVHVPPFEAIDFGTQMHFATTLVELLAAKIQTHEPARSADGLAVAAPPPTPMEMLKETLALANYYPSVADDVIASSASSSSTFGVFVSSGVPTLRSVMEHLCLLAESAGGDGEAKMVIAVRMDLKMSKGKIAAQCVHAALDAYRIVSRDAPHVATMWSESGEKTVCVKASSEDQLYAVAALARAAGFPEAITRDAGRTEVMAGTPTVVAVGPMPSAFVDMVTGRLPLL